MRLAFAEVVIYAYCYLVLAPQAVIHESDLLIQLPL